MHIAESFLPPAHAHELGLLPDGPLPRDVGGLLAALPERPGLPT
jgi:cobalt/nickel transport system ATP-binding protein